ncbi:MAG: holin, partial [Acidobacteria bacterium]|nr:holin [Acidobacteriota bacterium]
MFTASFVKAALERAVKTVAQALIAVFAASQANILTADWKAVLATAG